MSAAAVIVSVHGAVRLITLSQPAKRNALNREMLAALVRAMDVDDASGVRCIVLQGDPAGAAFSSGFDITRIDDAEKSRGLDPIQQAADAISACPVPVIAAIEGSCMGGGLEIAVACTLRVSEKSARLAMPPAKLGLVYSAAGLARFLSCVSPSFAQRMFLTGDTFDGVQAQSHGLLDLVTDGGGSALSEALRIAETIAKNAPLAVRGLLDAIRRLSRATGPLAEDLAAIDEARGRSLASTDLVEGVRAFIEKRKPVFQGR